MTPSAQRQAKRKEEDRRRAEAEQERASRRQEAKHERARRDREPHSAVIQQAARNGTIIGIGF